MRGDDFEATFLVTVNVREARATVVSARINSVGTVILDPPGTKTPVAMLGSLIASLAAEAEREERGGLLDRRDK